MGQIVISDINIRKGIFQGDSLFPLLFCLALDPLSKILNKQTLGYNLGTERRKDPKKRINHLLFMDDLKLFAENNEQLEKLLKVVHKFSKSIKMEFGLDKCAKCTIRAGKKVVTENIILEDNIEIKELEFESTYKYLGVEENSMIEHRKMREKIGTEYLRRLKKICRSQLNTKNKITAINQYALPVVSYSMGVVNWPQREINDLDIKTRKMLTLYKTTYRNQCLDRMYLPRSKGGLGLTAINTLHRAETVRLGQYLKSTKDAKLNMVKDHNNLRLSQATSITKLAKLFAEEHLIHLTDAKETEENPATKIARKAREKFITGEQYRSECKWKEQKRSEKFYEELNQPYIDKEKSLYWLQRGRLDPSAEKIIIARPRINDKWI